MTNKLPYPGIYVEEKAPIGAVDTSTAAFLGVAPAAEAHVDEAVACNNWAQFRKEFVHGDAPSTPLARAVYGFFMNGGGRCYVVNVGTATTLTSAGPPRGGLGCLEAIDEIAIVAAPGYHDPAAYEALLAHCERLQDRFAILDAPPQVDNIDLLKTVGSIPDRGAAETGAPAARPATEGL